MEVFKIKNVNFLKTVLFSVVKSTRKWVFSDTVGDVYQYNYSDRKSKHPLEEH